MAYEYNSVGLNKMDKFITVQSIISASDYCKIELGPMIQQWIMLNQTAPAYKTGLGKSTVTIMDSTK